MNNVTNGNVKNCIMDGVDTGIVTFTGSTVSRHNLFSTTISVADYGEALGGTTTDKEGDLTNTDPGFTDSANDDFTLAVGSAAIRSGDPRLFALEETYGGVGQADRGFYGNTVNHTPYYRV